MTTDLPPGFKLLESTSPFHELVGPFFARRDGATLIIGMRVAKKHINRRGAVHGGMICTLVDFAMGQAASAMTEPPRRLVTMNLSADFAGNAADGDWIEANVDVVRSGRRIVFVNCFVRHRSERIARGSATFLVLTSGA